MARKYQRISADCHLDMLWLPPELFTSNASSKLRDLMPYVAENSDGVKRWTDNNGAEYGLCGYRHAMIMSNSTTLRLPC